MTIQQWLFSFKGRNARFLDGIGLPGFAGMLALFSLAGKNLLDRLGCVPVVAVTAAARNKRLRPGTLRRVGVADDSGVDKLAGTG